MLSKRKMKEFIIDLDEKKKKAKNIVYEEKN